MTMIKCEALTDSFLFSIIHYYTFPSYIVLNIVLTAKNYVSLHLHSP